MDAVNDSIYRNLNGKDRQALSGLSACLAIIVLAALVWLLSGCGGGGGGNAASGTPAATSGGSGSTGGTGGGSAATAPQNVTPPTVTGTAQQGQTLTATGGTWTGTAPITTTGQWLRCDAAGQNAVDINGATNPTYQVAAADVGATLRYRETATNAAGSASASSSQTGVVTAPTPPAFKGTPTWTSAAGTSGGQPALGSVLVPRGTQILVLNEGTGASGTAITDALFTNLVAVEKSGTVVWAADLDNQILRKDAANAATILVDLSPANETPRGLRLGPDGNLWTAVSANGVSYSVRVYNPTTGAQVASFAVANNLSTLGVLPNGQVVVGAGTSVFLHNNSGALLGSRNLGSAVSGVTQLDNGFFAVGVGTTNVVAIAIGDTSLATAATYTIGDVADMTAVIGGSLFVCRASADNCQRWDRTP